MAKVRGSAALTPKSRLRMSCVSPSAANMPTPAPIMVRRAPRPSTRRTTSPGCAPRAMRMPNSRVRKETEYEISPYSPTRSQNQRQRGEAPEQKGRVAPQKHRGRLRDDLVQGKGEDGNQLRIGIS